MKITAMRYRELKTGSGYNHKAVELEGEVQDFETFDEAFAKLVAIVEAKVMDKSLTEIQQQRETLDWQVSQLTREHIRLQAEADSLRTSVERLRSEKKAATSEDLDAEIPF